MPLENGQGWSPNPSDGSICSSPMKDYCTNGKSDSISKDPPKTVVVLSKDTPESQPIEKIGTTLLLKLPIKKQRSLKTALILEIKLLSEFLINTAISNTTAIIPLNGSSFSNGGLEEFEILYIFLRQF